MSGRLELWGWVLALAAVGIVAAGGYTLYSRAGDDNAVTNDDPSDDNAVTNDDPSDDNAVTNDDPSDDSAVTSGEDGAGSAQNDGGSSDGDQTAPELAPEDAEPDPTSQGFTAIAAGGDHSCGLRTDGTAQCWGNNHDGQTDAPPGTFTAITAGGHSSCGLKTDGTAQCWGSTTTPVKQMRHQAHSPPSQPAGAGYSTVWAQNRRHRPMLGQHPLRSSGCAPRHIHRNRNRGPFVRAHNRRHRPMLGRKLLR